MKTKTVKALAGLLALLMLAGSLSACSGESFGSRLKNLFGSAGTHDGVTTRRPPRTTVPETTTKPSEIDEKMQLAPDLPGAEKVVKTIGGYQRVTYAAVAGNPYGAAAGTYLGEFKKEVTLEGKEVGGVALIPSVVKKLLEDALAKIPDGEGKWMVFVPADISELSEDSKINIEKIAGPSGNENSLLKINFSGGDISISNPLFSSNEELLFTNQITCSTISGVPFGIGSYRMPDGEYKQEWFTLLGQLKFSEAIYGQYIPFGEKVAETNSFFVEYISSNTLPQISNGRILRIDKSPVFVIDK